MIDQNQPINQTPNFTSPEVTSTSNYKPYLYTAVLAVIVVLGLGYYLMPAKYTYQPSSVLEDVPNASSTQVVTQPVTPQNPNSVVNPIPTPEPIACTMDAMMCPDGSYVGRSAPNCQFVCPSTDSTVSDKVSIEGKGFEIILPKGYSPISDDQITVDGAFKIFTLHNVNNTEGLKIPLVSSIILITGGYEQYIPVAPSYTKYINGRKFNVYDSDRKCSGDINGCMLIRYITNIDSETDMVFEVIYKTPYHEAVSLQEEEQHLASFQINEK